MVFGTFYIAVMAVLVPMLRGLRKELKTDIDGLKTDVKRVEVKVDREIPDLRSELRTELRAVNGRLDGTNMRVDRLVDALLTAPKKVS